MTIQISTNNEIILDGKRTGLGLSQKKEGTLIYTMESLLGGVEYFEHKMPYKRYSAASDIPNIFCAGRTQLEADIREILKNIEETK